ncbi:CoxG family protein [Defluviimonas sp. SAOS-178_SWC]|uniref:CoxG family protein n=1 Tax=Defluviimonas sp. SAOS-178_SWC TaxID=3121287 RepID=UPI003221B20A
MKLHKEFTLDRTRSEVWKFFHNVSSVADCLPGAEYLGVNDDGSHTGKMSMKVGPFQAAFEGAAKVAYDEDTHAISMEGKGIDRKGASRGKMTMDCRLIEADTSTKILVDADVQLSGPIAQFGRTGIIEEIASVLISDFVGNVETKMAPTGAAAAEPVGNTRESEARAQPKAPMSASRLLWLAIVGWFRSLFQRRQGMM